ncbi:MAG TPA: hypothetical protein VGS59_11685 [Candidatus Acidoferrales bacterium]|nr:hypothetical protein [Candidatus Acidoferrales bacterium]
MNAGQCKDPSGDPYREVEVNVVASARPDLRDPQVVLSLLEADQVVAAKQQTRFGRRPLSFGVRLAMWSLRVYVIAMFVIVVISVLRALRGGG